MKPKAKPPRNKSNHFMRIIALGRLVYGLILLGAGFAIFNLLGKNLAAEMLRLLNQWHIEAHLYYVHWLLQKVSTVNQGWLVLFAIGNFLYSALAFIEAIGLVMGKRWAYWLVIADTASFIPIETCQLFKEFGWINLILLIYYSATVTYLFVQLRRLPRLKKS
jgi:uncharacterized membrane protein (DUF2068 family)